MQESMHLLVESATGGILMPDQNMGQAKLLFHILVWVVVLGLGSTTNFMSKSMMDNKDGYTNLSDTGYLIAILSASSTIVGVVALLAGAAYIREEEYKKSPVINGIVIFTTTYGLVGSYYIFLKASEQPSTGFFWMAFVSIAFHTYAQCLLYSCQAKLEVIMLPRTFLPSLSASTGFVSALLISSGDFKNSSDNEFTDGQKTVAWIVPFATLLALVVMTVARLFTLSPKEGKNLGDYPVLRSFVLALFFGASVLSVYKLAFMTVDNSDSTAYIYALLSALFNFTILSVVFAPSSNAFGIYGPGA